MSGTAADGGYNLQQQSSGCPSSIPIELNLILSPYFLQDNGGPTPTIALVSGSPAIDQIPLGDYADLAGNPLTIDQRGYGRPFPTDGACDIGAYEFGAKPAAGGIGGLPPGTQF